MEKELKAKLSSFCDSECVKALDSNDKNSGTAAALAIGDTFTIVKGTFVPNVRTYESAEAAANDGVLANRINPDDDGKVRIDNSYYAVVVDNAPVQMVSLRAITSWSQLEDCPTDALRIPAGRSSAIFEKLTAYAGKTFEVVAREEWAAGDERNGRKMRFEGNAIAIALKESK